MSKGDNFAGGFLLGTVVGSLVGTVVGIVIGARSNQTPNQNNNQFLDDDDDSKPLGEQNVNANLEAKISQLNSAIEEVRHKLNLVNNDQDN
jgi:hypothetical protein